MKQTPGCRSVIADVIDGTLVVFCIRDNLSTTETDLRRTCRKWLPAFMVPGSIVLLDNLPYLASGKVDRKALQVRYSQMNSDSLPKDATFSPRAQEVIGLVKSTLSHVVGEQTPLDRAGLDSLSAIRIASQLRRRGLLEVDANTLLGISTTRELAALVDDTTQQPEPSENVSQEVSTAFTEIRESALDHALLQDHRDQVEDVYPCTSTQSAMLGETGRDGQAYCNWVKLAIITQADASQFEEALYSLARCHQLLRAGFLPVQSSTASHAVIVWRDLLPSQIFLVEQFNYAFALADEQALLRPTSFQFRPIANGFDVLIKLHHATYDQWSMDVLKLDLTSLLHGRDLGRPRPFRPLSTFYASNRDTAQSDESTDFWQSQLRGFTPTKIPQLRGEKVTKGLARTPWQGSNIATSSLRAWSKQRSVSNPSVFQAALAYLLGSYTGSADVTFGLVLSGRHISLPDIDTIFGPCLTTLPCRIDTSSTRTCSDLLTFIHDRNRAMQRHALTSPAYIKRVCDCDPGTAMFDTLFVWQETSLSGPGDLCVEEMDSMDRHEFHLVLEFEPSDREVNVRATYEQSLISAEQVGILLQQVNAVAQSIMEHPERPVADLTSAFPSELLSIANPTPTSCANDVDVVDIIQRKMDERPSSTAVLFAEGIDDAGSNMETLTYAQLRSQSNRLARYLTSHDVRPGDLVCICMEKSIDLYVAILATLVAGAGYLPILPETPQARMRSILSQANVKLCLCDETSSHTVSQVTDTEVAVVSRLDLVQYSTGAPVATYRGSDIAYTVFTSGSTGEPKGVAVTRDNLAGNIAVLTELYQVSRDSRLLQACSQAFDVSVFEIFFALSTGMTLCSATRAVLFRDLEHSIRAMGVTHLSLTPTVAALLDPVNVPAVRFLVTSGEGVTDPVHQRWAGKGLHQGYGPSETTNICTVNMDMSPDDLLGKIGPPLRNTSAFVVAPGEHLRILPAGAVGEFAFGGEQVFRGYLGMVELNAAKIVQHPEYGRIYRSGDVGRILADGTLFIAGRIDDQVKIRGNRVELGEITATLMKDAHVADCAAIVVHAHGTGDSLAVCWVPVTGRSAARDLRVVEVDQQFVRQLFRRLEASLPDYMIPDIAMAISKMPLTSQGKLDKRALRRCLEELSGPLRDSFSRHADDDRGDVGEEWSPDEQHIVRELKDVLRLPEAEVRRMTSFFALGLNSLNAIAFARSLERRLGRRVTVAQVLRNPTSARLARVLAAPAGPTLSAEKSDRNLSRCFSPDFVNRVKADHSAQCSVVNRILPCTPLQEAMLSASGPHERMAYCNTTAIEVAGDMAKLKICWEALVKRHDILRTRFVETESLEHPYAQVVLAECPLPWRWSTLDGEHVGPEREDISHVDLAHPFQILGYRSSSTSYIELQMHHALYDGVSMSVLLEEAEKIYRGQDLEPKVLFDPFLEEMLAQQSEEAKAFWEANLGDYRPKPFPGQIGSPAQECTVERTLPTDVASLQTFCIRHGVTPLSVFQAALAKVMGSCQAAQDVCFGNVVSGRSVPMDGIERLVAPCFNTVPIRVDLSTTKTHANLIQRLHQQNTKILGFQLTPLRRLQALSQKPHLRLFDALLLVQPPTRPLDASIWTVTRDQGSMGIPLVVEIVPEESSYRLTLHHMPPQVSSELAEALSHAFTAAVSDIVTYTSSAVMDYAVFDQYSIANRLEADLADSDDVAEDHESEAVVWSAEETQVRQVFAALTRVEIDRIRKNTSMYQLGLDSLNAAQVAARLRARGLRVDATDVIEGLTPRAIARAARAQSTEKSLEKPRVDLEEYDRKYRASVLDFFRLSATDVEAIRPCTAVQSGMLAQSLQSAGELYVNHLTYDVPDGVTVSAIRQAWERVQRKHPILRTAFYQLEDARQPFLMVILSTGQTSIPFEVVVKISSSCEEVKAPRIIAEEIVSDMRKPAWRISTFPSGKGVAMRLSIHHALFDAASLQLLMRDFEAAVRSEEIGSPMSIDPVLGFILNAAADQPGASEHFWRTTLERANIQRFPDLQPANICQGELHATTYESRLQPSRIEETCKRADATIQALGQAAWAHLLAAYSGEPTVTFGTVFSTRGASELEPTAFPSIVTVPIVCDTDTPFAQTTQSMVTYNATAQRHRFTSLADIQRFGGTADRPLFDTVFVYQKAPLTDPAQLTWSLANETAAVDYTASMELEITQHGTLALRLTVDRSNIPEAQASLMLKQYEYILADFVDGRQDNGIDVAAIRSIVPAECPELPSTVRLLHEFVEERARLSPHLPALEFVCQLSSKAVDRKTWTYRQLDEAGNQVAHLLLQHGVQPGRIVAVCMQKSAEASLAFLGILKAGCSFLAMDPDLPVSRQNFILEDSASALLFVNGGNARDDLLVNIPVIALNQASLSGLPTNSRDVGSISPSAVSYNLYTSGTTGNPKGCELTHENAVQAMLTFQRLFAGHWDHSSRWLQFASYWFDVSILEQFWSWSVGITVVGAPRDIVLDDLADFIRRLQITHIDLTPALARLLSPEEVPSLHRGVFITGGEALRQEIIDAWGPKMIICNGYGPTEATIGVTMNPFIGPDAKPSNIGPPFLNVGAFVLEPDTDVPVFRGAVGELCVSGKLVGKGYLNRPDLTATSFPYLDRLQARVYRTGDLVRLLADGSFSFIGRKDSQTKLRGQRLEIGEIDCILKSSSGNVTDAVSMVIKAREGGKETLVSFLVRKGDSRARELEVDGSGQARELASFAESACRNRLPLYMVPTHILPVSLLPLTVNNKVDVKRLVALYNSLTTKELQELRHSGNAQRPLDSTGRKIGAVLSRFLGIPFEQLSRDSNVFSLGLSSISAITLATLLKREGLAAASVKLIMTSESQEFMGPFALLINLDPTLGELSKALSDVRRQDTLAELNQIKQVQLSVAAFDQRYRRLAAARFDVSVDDIETLLPCTALQEGLIFDSIRHEPRPYFNVFRYALGDVDLAKVHRIFNDLSSVVQVLRARYIQTDDGFAQVILRDAQIPWHEWTSKLNSKKAGSSERRIWWLEKNSSELIQPLEVHVVQTSSCLVLEVFAHHCLYDGISWNLLLEKLAKAYQIGTIPDCGPSFSDALVRGPLNQRRDSKAFWQKRLSYAGYEPLPSSDQAEDHIHTVVATMEVPKPGRVENLRKRLGVSHQALLQACFEVALQQLYPSTQVYGTVVSGRSFGFDGADRVIGPLFNTLPTAIAADGADTWAKLISKCQGINASVLPYQHTPLRDIRKWCGQGSSDPMFDVLFVFQHDTMQAHDLWREMEQQPRADYPLSFEITLQEDQSMIVTAIAQENFVSGSDADTLLQIFSDALECACEQQDHQIQEVFQWSGSASKPHTNRAAQVPGDVNGVTGFQWSAEAETLRKIVAQVAGVDPSSVDEHSTIFAFGIDSIETVKLASRAKNAGLPIPVSKILQAQTIHRMLQHVTQSKAASKGVATTNKLEELEQYLSDSLRPTLSKNADIERILPATPNQEALIADLLRSDFREYYNHDVLLLQPHTDVSKLRDAWQMVVDRNPILRTGFVQVDNPDVAVAFAQIVHRPAPVTLNLHEAPREKDIQSLLVSITKDVAAVANGASPLRLSLVRVETARYLVLSLSHAQYDGHSLGLLHEDVHRAYWHKLDDRSAYDELIEQSLTATSDAAKDFWINTLSGARHTRLPSRETSEAESPTHRTEIAAKMTGDVARSFCRRNGVSMQALAQTCWSLVLAFYTRSLEVMFGVVLACRDSEEAERVMFPTMNTIAMRASLHGSRQEILQYVQSMINDMRPHQRTPLRVIQQAFAETTRGRDSRAFGGLFDTLFIYQHKPDAPSDMSSRLYDSVGGSSSVEYPVAVEMEAVAGDIILRTACKDNVFDAQGTQQLLEHFDTVLTAIVEEPECPTVDFTDKGVSICGLRPFELESEAKNLYCSQIPVGDVEEGMETSSELTPLAVTIREVLAQVSKVPAESITPATTIESIGVDSISAIKVASLLRKQSVTLSVSEIIRARSVRRITDTAAAKSGETNGDAGMLAADVVSEALGKRGLSDVSSALNIDRGNIEDVLPATAGQVYMLSIWQKSGGQLFYPTFKYQLGPGFQDQQIEAAWHALVDRHSILRTVFTATDDADMPVLQVVLAKAKNGFSCGDQVEVTTSRTQPMVALHARKMPDGHALELSIHHALYDAVSLPLLMQDFQARLTNTQLHARDLTRADFAALSVTDEVREARRTFWTSYLRGAKQLAKLRQPESRGRQKRIELFHPGVFEQCVPLEQLARRQGVAIQALLFAAYAKLYANLLSTQSPQNNNRQSNADAAEDVVLGMYLANRSHLPNLDTLAAPTINLVPLRVRTPSRCSLVDVAKQIQADLQDIRSAGNSAVGLWEIEKWTGVKVDTSVNFLRLPEKMEEEEQLNGDGENASLITEVNERRERGYSRVVDAAAGPEGSESFKGLESLRRVEGSYLVSLMSRMSIEGEDDADIMQYSLDVEAVVADGSLDVGVFCPVEMLGLEDAEKIIAELSRSFEELVGEANV